VTATYRLVHFSPDPFTGARFPLGAIVVADGAVHVAKSSFAPSAECLGDPRLAVVVQRLQARLDTVVSGDALPDAFGPYTTLAAPSPIPEAAADPLAWVETLLNPVRQPAHAAPPRSQHRATLGFRLFEVWNVARYVRKTFHPATDWGGRLSPFAASLAPVSHWVASGDEALLMEPVLPQRARLDADIREVAQRLAAYRYALDRSEVGQNARVVVFVPSGGTSALRSSIHEGLAPVAHEVVDTDDDGQRTSFLDEIQRLGAAADRQAPFTAQA
jgi:hypothetical protein